MKNAWLALALAVSGCAQATTAPPQQPAPQVEVPAQPPQTEPPPPVVEPTPDPGPIDLSVKEDDDSPGPLPQAWSWTFNHANKYAVAKQNVQTARTSYVNAKSSFTAGNLPAPGDFEKANAALEFLNRSYAGLYYAPDATDEQRIATLEEASKTLLDWASYLDTIGLDKLPKSFRTSGSIALTFEDVVHGPAKRWRGEGLSLANACVARAKSNNVSSTASKSCDALVKANANLPQPPHAKTKPECACVPGDPLCSATMSGWCHPK